MVDARAVAPGRVNLIGDHTDHTGGWVLPMAVDLVTTIEFDHRDEPFVDLWSDRLPGVVRFDLPVTAPRDITPPWGRYVAAVAAEIGPTARGISGRVTSAVPVGGGLSSSAALTVAAALALGADQSDPVALAQLCQRAEHAAVGVPCGIMDPLTSIAAVDGCALLIDTLERRVTPVPIPKGVDIVVVDSGLSRSLEASPYAERRTRCDKAAQAVGSLRSANMAGLAAIDDAEVRAAGRHVMTENQRVLEAADALGRGDVATVGRLMVASHVSLRDDLDVSTPEIDGLVERMVATPGVYGSRLTGAGFGGFVVALAEPGAIAGGLVVRAVGGARLAP